MGGEGEGVNSASEATCSQILAGIGGTFTPRAHVVYINPITVCYGVGLHVEGVAYGLCGLHVYGSSTSNSLST